MQQSLNIRKFTGFAFLASILNTIIYFIATSADALSADVRLCS
jgi:hypothetical protein